MYLKYYLKYMYFKILPITHHGLTTTTTTTTRTVLAEWLASYSKTPGGPEVEFY